MRDRWQEDQDAPRRGVVQVRPSQLDLLQFAEHLGAEGLNSVLVIGFGRGRSKLPVQVRPGEMLRGAQGEGSVGEPQV